MIKGIDQLQSLMRKLQTRQGVIDEMNGAKIDLKKTSTFVKGPYLHQDVKDGDGNLLMSERESAQFELDNPELFNYLRDIKSRLDRSLEG